MSLVQSIHTSPQYTWGDGCNGWHLLQSPTLSVIQERMPPQTAETRHFHQKAQQLFYILSGTATFVVNDTQLTVQAQECLHIPAGVPHCIYNQAAVDLHFLVISEPLSHGDRVVSE